MRHLRSSAHARETNAGRWPACGWPRVRPGRIRAVTAVWFRVAAVLASAALAWAAVPALAASGPAGPARAALTASRTSAAPGSAQAVGRSSAGPGHRLYAVIRRTAGGVPHILARDWTSLGFGYGFAFAQDNLCTMASDYVTVEAQRSRYFGPGGSYIQRANGVYVTNLDSDLFFRQIIDAHTVERLIRGLSPAELQLEAGYVRGYNHYLASVGGAQGIPDPACRGQAWVKPITVQDSYLRFYQLMLLLGEDTAIGGIAQAAPPPAQQSAAGARSGHGRSGRPAARGARAGRPVARRVREGRQ